MRHILKRFGLAAVWALALAGVATPAMARFLSVDPVPVDKTDGANFNRYWYANNNPYKYVDPDGRWAETAWDATSLAIGATSLVGNVQQGNWGSAAIDAGGILVDAVLTAIPVVPAGAGAAISASRAADNVADAAKQGICASCGGRTTTSEARAAQAHGMSTPEVKDSIHALKEDAGSATKQTNGNIEICTSCGEVYPQAPDNKLGDSIGNIKDK